jgi:hypothetical protein
MTEFLHFFETMPIWMKAGWVFSFWRFFGWQKDVILLLKHRIVNGDKSLPTVFCDDYKRGVWCCYPWGF